MPTPHTILVVDDEVAVQTVLARQLRALGYTVQTAGTADSALELMSERTEPFDLVLIDIIMPCMNGTELASLLLERDPQQAIVLMSAWAPNGLADFGAQAGFVPVLKKPIDAVELGVVLEQALAPSAPFS